MKRLLTIVLALLFMMSCVYAESEITFNSIPWLSDENATIQVLLDHGLVKEGYTSFNYSEKSGLYIIEDDTGFVLPDRISGADNVTFSASLGNAASGKIAGYPVKDLTFTYAYDGEKKLVAVKVELINATYDNLKEKITKVYGEGETRKSEEGLWSSVWKGENNTAIVMYTQSEGYNFTLMYGRLDAAEIIYNCLIPADLNDLTGL